MIILISLEVSRTCTHIWTKASKTKDRLPSKWIDYCPLMPTMTEWRHRSKPQKIMIVISTPSSKRKRPYKKKSLRRDDSPSRGTRIKLFCLQFLTIAPRVHVAHKKRSNNWRFSIGSRYMRGSSVARNYRRKKCSYRKKIAGWMCIHLAQRSNAKSTGISSC